MPAKVSQPIRYDATPLPHATTPRPMPLEGRISSDLPCHRQGLAAAEQRAPFRLSPASLTTARRISPPPGKYGARELPSMIYYVPHTFYYEYRASAPAPHLSTISYATYSLGRARIYDHDSQKAIQSINRPSLPAAERAIAASRPAAR